MIKAVGKGATGRTTVFLGLSRENTDRLHAGEPIPINLGVLDDDLANVTVILLAGATEDDIVDDLRSIGVMR